MGDLEVYGLIEKIAARTATDKSLQGDLASEMFIAYKKLSTGIVQQLYEDNEFEHYLRNMAFRMYHVKRSDFHKTYRRPLPTIQNGDQIDDFDELKEAVSSLHWYKQKILEFYIEFGTIQKVSDYTKINYESIKKTLQEIKKTVKKNYENKCNIPVQRAA